VEAGFPRDKRENAFVAEIMLKQKDRADDDSKKSHPASRKDGRPDKAQDRRIPAKTDKRKNNRKDQSWST
jgi:hypothetical protein